jgi:hypothetical protein
MFETTKQIIMRAMFFQCFLSTMDANIHPHNQGLPGKRLQKNYGKSPCLIGRSTVSMAIFNSKLFVYQRLSFEVINSFIMASALRPLWARFSMERSHQVISQHRREGLPGTVPGVMVEQNHFIVHPTWYSLGYTRNSRRRIVYMYNLVQSTWQRCSKFIVLDASVLIALVSQATRTTTTPKLELIVPRLKCV